MKSIVILLAISLSLVACKKESGDNQPKETLLSEILTDGLHSLKFSYDSKNLLTKLEAFKEDPTDNTLINYITFQYNDKDQITQFTSYTMPGNVAVGKATIQYNGSGQLVSASSYDLQGASPNTVNYINTFTYNVNGQVIKAVEKDKGGKLTVQKNLLYFDDGHIKETQSWKETDGELWMSGKTSFSLPNGFYPNGMEQLEVLLGPDFIGRMHSETISYRTYSQIGVVTKHWNAQMSAREFNDDGTLKKQVVTHIHVKPESDDDVFLYEYKYLKQ